MIPRPPRSTLFPYTTLFPSVSGTGLHTGAATRAAFRPGTAGQGVVFRDRKSTRLNSSHGYISYAVFCLEKKKRSVASSLAYSLRMESRNRHRVLDSTRTPRL